MKIKLENVRLSFPDLFVATRMRGDTEGDAKFKAHFLMPADHPSAVAIRETIKEVAKIRWAEKAEGVLKAINAAGKSCLCDGNTKEYDGYADMLYISTSAKTRPLVLNSDKTPLTAEDGKPYAGCYVNASVDIWAQDNSFGKRINASLRGVQFLRDGDAFSSSAPASVGEFDDLSDGANGMSADDFM